MYDFFYMSLYYVYIELILHLNSCREIGRLSVNRIVGVSGIVPACVTQYKTLLQQVKRSPYSVCVWVRKLYCFARSLSDTITSDTEVYFIETSNTLKLHILAFVLHIIINVNLRFTTAK